jgi:hypothetical protein
MTVPDTTPSSSLIFSMSPQARSYWARFLDRISRPVLVLLGENQGLDLVADGDDLARVDVVLDGQLAGGDDALGLVADVEQDLVLVDLDDDSLDDVAVVEVLDGGVDRGEQVLLRTDVVDRDLGNSRAGSHVVGAPIVDRWSRGRAWARSRRTGTYTGGANERTNECGRSDPGTAAPFSRRCPHDRECDTRARVCARLPYPAARPGAKSPAAADGPH